MLKNIFVKTVLATLMVLVMVSSATLMVNSLDTPNAIYGKAYYNNAPASGISVSASGSHGQITVQGNEFKVDSVPSNSSVSVTVQCSSPTGTHQATQSVYVDSYREDIVVNIYYHQITGTVTYNGQAVSGAQVCGGGKTATTASDGSFTLTDVPSGTYNVEATYNGHSASTSVNVGSGVETVSGVSINIQYTEPSTNPSTNPSTTPPGSSTTIQGTVRYCGEPVSGATISVGGIYVITNVNGFYKMTGMGCGALYSLTAKYNNTSQTKTVTTPANGGTITVDFDLGTPVIIGNLTTYTTIIGRVTYNGTAAPWAIVSADNSTDVTDEDGNYTLEYITSNATLDVTATYNGLSRNVTVTTPAEGGTIVVDIEILPPESPTPIPSSDSSLWIWLLLLALIAIAIAVAYLLYNRNK